MPKVITLLRVSGAAQAGPDREGLPVQREDCEALANAHGLEIVESLELQGVSGAAVLEDPRFTALLARLQEPDIDGVVVAAFDRLFRPGRFGDYAILDHFADTGTHLYCSQGAFDMRTDAGALQSLLLGQMGGAERKAIARRTAAGRERKRREQGIRAEGPVGMPRGVSFSKAEGWAYLWPEAERIREVYRLFLAGETNLAAIARATGYDRTSGKRGSPSWAIRSILTQPLYMGVYRVDRKWSKGGKSVPRTPEDCYEHQVLEPPLVSPRDWHRVQARLAELSGARPRIPSPGNRPLDYLGHLDCVGCGAPLSSRRETRTKRTAWSYVCARSYRGDCDTFGQLSGQVVDEYLHAALERVLGDVDTLTRIVDEALRAERETATQQPREVERRLAELDNQRRRLMDAYQTGDIELPDLRKRATGIDNEREALRTLQMGHEGVQFDESAAESLVDVFSSWAILRRQERQSLLEAFEVRIGMSRVGQRRRAVPRVEWVRLGTLGDMRMDVGLYKKMRRLGIE